ncbi:MAG: SIMPL domain-containing protein [Anaerolineaceae bacterium]|nr:SIMPL domain-containing protein [Anaerolineaceae bacterium]
MTIKRITIIISILLITLVLGACAPAQVGSDAKVAANEAIISQMNVNGTGQVYLIPDIAYIYIGVITESEDVATALTENNNSAQKIVSDLSGLGIAEEDIQTTSFNVFPVTDYSPMGEPLETKYRIENTVNITVRDLGQIGNLLSIVVQSGANNIHGIQFDVLDKSEAVKQARQMAVDQAKQQAEELAEAADVELVRILSISAYDSGLTMPMAEGKINPGLGGGQAPISAGQLIISADANLTYEIK